MSEFGNDLDLLVGKKAKGCLVTIGFLMMLYIIISLIFSFWPFSVGAGIAKAVVNEVSIISNYQWFYDQYNAIQSQQANLETLPLEAYERNGIRMVLNNMIGEYNSRSRQITRNLWKAKDLPYSIELKSGGSR